MLEIFTKKGKIKSANIFLIIFYCFVFKAFDTQISFHIFLLDKVNW